MQPPEFSITVGRSRDVVRIAVEGELDLATAPQLAAHLDAAARPGGAVVLDLARLSFLDSSGVALLLGVTRRAAREAWTLTISGTPPAARDVLELCGLIDVLPLDD
jgi:anti-sigma B factor antagonist